MPADHASRSARDQLSDLAADSAAGDGGTGWDGLADLPNAFLLPHVGSAEVGSRAGMARKAAENAVAMARGEKPPYEVTP